MIELDYGGRTYQFDDSRLEEVLNRAAAHCGREMTDDEKAAQARRLKAWKEQEAK